MPSRSTDPERIRAAAHHVAAVGEHAGEVAAEMLDHLVVLGERDVQVEVDRFLEQVADTSRAVAAEAAELRLGLSNAARRASDAEARVSGELHDATALWAGPSARTPAPPPGDGPSHG